MNESLQNIGNIVGSFIGAGVVVAVGTEVIRRLLSRIGVPKNGTMRLVIACYTIPVLAVCISSDRPVAAIVWSVAATVVFVAHILRAP